MIAPEGQLDFPRTRWSLVIRLDAYGPDEARAALVDLALRYWYPVYAYMRLCGHTPAVAQDIALAFFRQLPRQYTGDDVAMHGGFRVWLLASLRAFLASDWRELACGEAMAAVPDPQALETRFQRDRDMTDSPERAYQRSFALEVLRRGCRRLCVEADGAGHLDMFVELRPFLARDPLSGQYEAMCRRLQSTPAVLAIALQCLRLRLQELVRGELADTVASREDMLDEQRALHGILCGNG